MADIKNILIDSKKIMDEFLSDEENFRKIEEAGKIIVQAIKTGNKIISCGNGGSMCDAMHFAEELSGRFRNDRKPFPAVSISDAAYITCTGNDYGFEKIFSRFVEAMGKEGDVLMAISTSGNSVNVLEAIAFAKKKKMAIVGLTGRGGGKMKEMCDVEIRAPYSEFSDRAQEIHIKVIHALIEYAEDKLK